MARKLFSLMNLLFVSAILVGCNAPTPAPVEPGATLLSPTPELAIEARVEDLLSQLDFGQIFYGNQKPVL